MFTTRSTGCCLSIVLLRPWLLKCSAWQTTPSSRHSLAGKGMCSAKMAIFRISRPTFGISSSFTCVCWKGATTRRFKQADVPWRITFDTNPDTCNLKCVMCEEHSPYSDLQPNRRSDGGRHRRMPFDLLKRIVEETAGRGLREIIPSTMGEPLLYEHFEDILALCETHKVKLNLTTNGTFPKIWCKGMGSSYRACLFRRENLMEWCMQNDL